MTKEQKHEKSFQTETVGGGGWLLQAKEMYSTVQEFPVDSATSIFFRLFKDYTHQCTVKQMSTAHSFSLAHVQAR